MRLPPRTPPIASDGWPGTFQATNTPEDLVTLRRYTRAEAAQMLKTPESWLKVWVTQDAIPHQRSGKPGPRQRGAWFTYDTILAIGRMLPDLMSTRQANQRAEAPREEACLEGAALAAGITDGRTAPAPRCPGPSGRRVWG